jgi:hypothetical protein
MSNFKVLEKYLDSRYKLFYTVLTECEQLYEKLENMDNGFTLLIPSKKELTSILNQDSNDQILSLSKYVLTVPLGSPDQWSHIGEIYNINNNRLTLYFIDLNPSLDGKVKLKPVVGLKSRFYIYEIPDDSGLPLYENKRLFKKPNLREKKADLTQYTALINSAVHDLLNSIDFIKSIHDFNSNLLYYIKINDLKTYEAMLPLLTYDPIHIFIMLTGPVTNITLVDKPLLIQYLNNLNPIVKPGSYKLYNEIVKCETDFTDLFDDLNDIRNVYPQVSILSDIDLIFKTVYGSLITHNKLIFKDLSISNMKQIYSGETHNLLKMKSGQINIKLYSDEVYFNIIKLYDKMDYINIFKHILTTLNMYPKISNESLLLKKALHSQILNEYKGFINSTAFYYLNYMKPDSIGKLCDPHFDTKFDPDSISNLHIIPKKVLAKLDFISESKKFINTKKNNIPDLDDLNNLNNLTNLTDLNDLNLDNLESVSVIAERIID